MIDVRAGVLAITICFLIYIVMERPRPVSDHQEPYCVVTYPAARQLPDGSYERGFATGYAPCRLQDIYRNI